MIRTLTAVLAVFFLPLLALGLPAQAGPFPTGATPVEEFDDGFGEWASFPELIGQTPGWEIVRNDGEQAARNSPSGASGPRRWALANRVDLGRVKSPELDLKLDFRGGDYSLVEVLVGSAAPPRQRRRIGPRFTSIARWETATDGPEEHRLDLSPWAGEEVLLRVVLRKPDGVVTSRVGLYVHRIGVVEALPEEEPVEEPRQDQDDLHIGAFNIQVFGRAKMDREGVPEILADVITDYDLVVVQEIRDASGEAIAELHALVEERSGWEWGLALSDRLGRTSSTEQYAMLYRLDKLVLMDAFHVDDGEEPDGDLFHREPYVVRFADGFGRDFAVVPLHADPDEVPEEMAALAWARDVVEARWADPDMLILGDFNADCRYLSDSELLALDLFVDETVTWWIDDDADTTVHDTDCAYDRILSTGPLSADIVPDSARVDRFDLDFSLTQDEALRVSDHYPVRLAIAPPSISSPSSH